MTIKQIEMQEMNLKEIEVATYNPRKELKAGDPAYERLKSSIMTYGYIDPLIYNRNTGRLVGGHQRLNIMRDLGVETAQVSVVELDEMQEKDLNIRLNRVHGEFENKALAEVLQELEQEEFDLDNLGFDQREFDELMYEMEMEEERSGSFLDGLIQRETEGNEPDNTDYTGINTGETRFSDHEVPSPYGNEDANTREKGTDSEHELYTTYTKPDSEPETEPYEKEQGEQYFKMMFPVTFEERDVVMEALKRAKRNHGLSTSSEALLQICNKYLGSERP